MKSGKLATRGSTDVALKVLPEAFTSDPDRRVRFDRDATVHNPGLSPGPHRGGCQSTGMPLDTGTQLGPHEIVSAIEAGATAR